MQPRAFLFNATLSVCTHPRSFGKGPHDLRGWRVLFLSTTQFQQLLAGNLSDEPTTQDLEAKHFIYRGDPALALRLLAAKLRTRKSFLRGGPSLHIFVVTLRCDHACHYCQVSRQNAQSRQFDMTVETAQAAVDLMFTCPARELTVEFQGGEPLLAFDIIRSITKLINERNSVERRRITFTITSTLHYATDEILKFLHAHEFHVSTSLDGPASLHNANRPNLTRDAHERTIRAIEKTRHMLGFDRVAALVTLTRRSLGAPEAIIDEYVRLGFTSIFLRPVAPFGFAARSASKLGFLPADFLEFYDRALAHILALNWAGIQIAEATATILLTSILTPFPTTYTDLRSPSGAGLGTLVYNYDGSVYASDEGRMLAEMGITALRMGSVTQPYQQLLRSDALQLLAAAGLAESLPGCSDCAFVPYCGSDVAAALAREGDPVGHRARSEHCTRHTGLFQLLFRYLAAADPEIIRIFLAWVHHRPPLNPASVS